MAPLFVVIWEILRNSGKKLAISGKIAQVSFFDDPDSFRYGVLMRLKTFLLPLFLFALEASASDLYPAYFKCAEEHVIAMPDASEKPDVLALMKAFQKEFPVALTGAFLEKAAAGKLSQEDQDLLKKGVFATEEDDDGNEVMARVWNAGDRKLLGVSFHIMADVLYDEKVCFYSYDPKSRELKTVSNELTSFRPQYASATGVVKSYYAFDEDSAEIMNENVDGLLFGMVSVFARDGASFRFRGARILLPAKRIREVKKINPAFYAFYDIDGDGNSELIFSDKGHAREKILSVVPNADLDSKKRSLPADLSWQPLLGLESWQ